MRRVLVGSGTAPLHCVLSRRLRSLLVLLIVVPVSLTFEAATANSRAGAITATLTLGALSPTATPEGQSYVGTAAVSGGVAPYTKANN